MTVKFYKYQGTGNDFIMIDNRVYGLDKNQTSLVKRLCDRKFGIGADGLILLNEKISYDFEMVYFNSDGNESSMCGNGGRCLIKFANQLGLIKSKCRFMAIDGEHEGEISPDGEVSLKMKDVDTIGVFNNVDLVIDTGSPHYVTFVKDVAGVDLVSAARKIRYSDNFKVHGINVNFVEQKDDAEIYVRTYERGVEDETLSCGTGVVASSLALAHNSAKALTEVDIKVPGGHLKVKFEAFEKGFKNIYLIGPAEKVFEGSVEV